MTRYRRVRSTVWRVAAGHLLLRKPRGPIVDVGGGAGAVWIVLEEPHSGDEVAAEIAQALETAVDDVVPAVEQVLAELQRLGFVEVVA